MHNEKSRSCRRLHTVGVSFVLESSGLIKNAWRRRTAYMLLCETVYHRFFSISKPIEKNVRTQGVLFNEKLIPRVHFDIPTSQAEKLGSKKPGDGLRRPSLLLTRIQLPQPTKTPSPQPFPPIRTRFSCRHRAPSPHRSPPLPLVAQSKWKRSMFHSRASSASVPPSATSHSWLRQPASPPWGNELSPVL